MASVAATDVLRDYAKTQAELCDEIVREYRIEDDLGVVFSLPKDGKLTLNGENWSFAKHGSGIRFISDTDSRVIDAHVRIVSLPTGLDASRLFDFFESSDTHSLHVDDQEFKLGTEAEIDTLLSELARRGDLKVADETRRLYAPV
jgi:hypothetical protein